MSISERFIEYIKTKLPISGKNTKLLKELSESVGEDAAYALISQLGIGDKKGKASKDEIKLIAYMIEPFKPLKIETYEVNEKPLKVVLEGVGPEGSTIRIYPQFQVPQNGFDEKQRDWSIDVAIRCFKTIKDDEFDVCGIALEYDGHDAHFRDHNIERSYLRDISIKESTRFSTIHVTKESWNKKKQIIKNSIVKSISSDLVWFDSIYKKAFSHGMQAREKVVQYESQPKLSQKLKEKQLLKLPDCPKCLGICNLYGNPCDYCNGRGSVSQIEAKLFNSETHGYVTCPHCDREGLDCHMCGGMGEINVRN